VVKTIETDREQLNTRKDALRESSTICSDLKSEIEQLTNTLQTMKATDESEFIEADYFDKIKQLKKLKGMYKSNLDHAKELK